MAVFLDGFKRLSSELEISERRLCIEIGLDQSRISGIRKRLKNGDPVQGPQIDVLLAIKEKFPTANLQAFFDTRLKFFTRVSGSSEVLLNRIQELEKEVAYLTEILNLYRNK